MRRRRLITAGIALAVTLGAAGDAHAQSSVSGSVEPAVRSVTVSPGSVPLNACLPLNADPKYANFTLSHLQFPNGYCTTPGSGTNRETPPITITNGNATSQIFVAATNATANGGGWNLCRGPGTAACAAPGANQFTLLPQKLRCRVSGEFYIGLFPGGCETPNDPSQQGPYLFSPPDSYIGTNPSCDQVFDLSGFTAAGGQATAAPGCSASPGEVSREFLTLQGPTTTGSSSTHSFTVTWSAVP